MSLRYTLRDYLHYARLFWRNQRRQRAWGRQFEAAIRDGSFQLPAATVVQLIPTEACNLRCPMCNQWGENGYFLQGVRPVEHMDEKGLTQLLRNLSPKSWMISVHGGEPFAYKHLGTLLELLREQQFDVIFSTNGTLLDRNLEQLAQLKNLALLLSIDGDEKTHDKIRGEGRFRQAKEAVAALFELARRRKMPRPLVFMSFVVCEWNTEAIAPAYEVACDLGVFALNYNMRWFLSAEVGAAYEKHLQQHFGLQSSGAWRGWISNHAQPDYQRSAAALRHLLRRKRFKIRPPYVTTMPRDLDGNDFENYFTDYLNVFGNESCFMPFYWARIHANGDLIYCPGHPDIITGNVFRDGFMESFNSATSIKFRKHILHNRLPICNRCCGLYMTYTARPSEQKARRNLGLSKQVTANFP